MKSSVLLSICCVLLLCAGCASEAAGTIPRLPWPSHAPMATPYVRVPEQNETPPTPKAEYYDSWEEMLESFYVAENNFWFHDWELEMFKALPQDEPYIFTVHLATRARHDNEDVMAAAKELAGLGAEVEVWDMVSIYEGVEEHYYICFVRCTPNELWALSGKTQEYYQVEQQYESVARRCDKLIWPEEGERGHG